MVGFELGFFEVRSSVLEEKVIVGEVESSVLEEKVIVGEVESSVLAEGRSSSVERSRILFKVLVFYQNLLQGSTDLKGRPARPKPIHKGYRIF